ncbi:MAG: sulfatase activating formylglycine-generating enzyme, partial [Planctomycetota bacterium]
MSLTDPGPANARSAASRVFALCACLVAAISLPLLAIAQEKKADVKESSVYPTAPTTPPPPTRVENSEAVLELKPYAEIITGTEATFQMLPIPGGTFLMGSPADEADRKDWEGPQIPVQVSPFWMSQQEVRWNEYSLFMDSLDKRRRAQRNA